MSGTITTSRAAEAALLGLDWMVRTQCDGECDANRGRLPEYYDCSELRRTSWTTNWTTGVALEALLAGYFFNGREQYLQAARRAAEYLKSLQVLSVSASARVRGVFREVTPQSPMAHPRDALTAAWALLDFGRTVGDDDAVTRAVLFADWFLRVGMEQGYPYWTVRLDDPPWDPPYCGSFHSGGAFFFHRLFQVTGETRYADAMRTILDFYNEHHLAPDGRIAVIVSRDGFEVLDGKVDESPVWQEMHRYNDDFGALANLAAWRDLGDQRYHDAARRFCLHMAGVQRDDGGFGPKEYSVPSAGGAVLMELTAARHLGCDWVDETVLERAAGYLLSQQWKSPGHCADGAFLGLASETGNKDSRVAMRTSAYAVLALLRYAGARDSHYFFGPENSVASPNVPAPS